MEPFKFKQFTIVQDKTAMKVGTDAVLLGAWTSLNNNPFSILDIGAGTGILSLMLAQRSNAELIDALEIDGEAYEQCVENFEASPWNDRLFCYHASLQEFVDEMDETYDLIISNPPFFDDSYKTNDPQRDMARFSDALPFDVLCESCASLLSKEGLLSVIIPYAKEQDFIDLASRFKLYPLQITHVKGNPNAEIKRSLMEFSFKRATPKVTTLIIETARHQFTEDYIQLTKDFYLKM